MLDFILGLFLAGLLVRGWLRGFVREALDLVGLVVGLFIAFKLSGPLGDFLTERFGVGPEVATIGGGIVLFLLFGIATSIAAHYLTRVMSLPGLNLINRFGGAMVATAWGVAILVVVLNVARVSPLPDTWKSQIDDSSVAQALVGTDALPQGLLSAIAGENVLGHLTAIQDLFGQGRVVPEGDEVVSIPPAASDEVRQVRDDANEVLSWVNEYRAGQGLRALGNSESLQAIAEQRGVGMYTNGRISRDTPVGLGVAADLSEAGVRLAEVGENLALASSARAGFDGILESITGKQELEIPDYDRVGIAVVDGPTGRLLVMVLGG
ncbi:MAG: CvpA family protein [Acidimicrobiia bacterium]